MVGINLAFTRSSLCLVLFSSDGQDGLDRVVDEEVGSPLMDDACTPMDNPLSDMTLLVIRSIKTSSTTFSAALNSFDIHTRSEQSRVWGTN